MARLKTRGLRKTVGVPGLFATAYGNVGSSIYYALGLVAAHALGLTPLVFMFAGALFALTAKTYAEGAAMFPEAGGSSSFARHAFNEVVSFIAGWGLSLDYILTIAISAFFVPHYLGAFFPELRHSPGDVLGGAAVIALLALVNIRGLGESAKLNIALAVLDLFTQIALVALGAILVLHPSVLVDQVHLGVAPSFSQLIFAVSISMLAYTGIETVSNMAEEARDPGEQVPKAVNLVLIAVLGIYAGISIVALSALPVTQDAAGHYSTQLGTTYANDPVLGIVAALHLHGAAATAAQYYVGALAIASSRGRSRSSTPVSTPRGSRSSSSRRSRSRSCCPGTRPSSAISTASGRCSPSRSPTSRSSRCAGGSRTATGPTGRRGTCAGEAARSRSPP